MSDTRDRTYCREHCKGFRDTGGRCFADGECEKYTEYMRNYGTTEPRNHGNAEARKKKSVNPSVRNSANPGINDADVEHYADVVEAVFAAENKVLPAWRERLQQAPTLNSADRLHLARDYTRAIAREILLNQQVDE